VDLDGATLKSLSLTLGATAAHVRGVAGLNQVEIRGTACASNPEWLQDLRLETSRSGDHETVTVGSAGVRGLETLTTGPLFDSPIAGSAQVMAELIKSTLCEPDREIGHRFDHPEQGPCYRGRVHP
jgi:hypothetical protein